MRDVGNLRWYGATPLKKPQDYDTEEKQRAHANRYLTALLGKYEDKYSNTDTRKFKDKYGLDAFGKHSKNRWSKNKKQYMPRHDVKGARATALAAYNLRNADEDDTLPLSKVGISPDVIALVIDVISLPKSIKTLLLYVFAWISPCSLEPDAIFVNSNIWSIPVFCVGYFSYNVVSFCA